MAKRQTNRKIKHPVRIAVLLAAICGFALLSAGAETFLNWSALTSGIETFFDQPLVEESTYQVDERQMKRYVETADRYEIRLEYPQMSLRGIDTAIWAYAGEQKAAFLSMVTGADRQTQPKGVRPFLHLSSEVFQVGSYTSVYINAVRESGGVRTHSSKAFLYQSEHDQLLKTADVFAENSGYLAKLSNQLSKAWEELPSKPQDVDIQAIANKSAQDPGFFDGRLILTESGVCVALDGSLTGGENLLVNEGYLPFAEAFKIALPEGLLPVIPKPSRVINVKKDKVVALTFDDGPTKYTPKVLSLLAQYNAHATFFVVGYNVDNHPHMIRQIVAQGCEVGDHTQTHANLTTLTTEQAMVNVNTVLDKVEKVASVRPALLRPPGGHITDELARQINMPIILWDVDPQDWKKKDAAKVAQHIIKNVKSGDIVLLHDLYQSTVDALPTVLKELSAQGYEFVTVSELLNGRGDFAGKIVRNRNITAEEAASVGR